MKKWIESVIENFIRGYEENSVIRWGDPIVGFADAKAAAEYAAGLMPNHGKPEDVMPDASAIVAYYVPLAEDVAKTNEEGEMASEEWALAYEETNQLIDAINVFLGLQLMLKGYKGAVHPGDSRFDRDSLTSEWSHRHMAYMAGLGTFGINNMLITEKGCCGRFGTIITNLPINVDGEECGSSEVPAGIRNTNAVCVGAPMTDELCAGKKDGSCSSCMDACPMEALSQDGFDRQKCYEMCMKNAEIHNKYGSSYEGSGGSEVCGKCVAGMPCSFL